jgi:hypothetical protein
MKIIWKRKSLYHRILKAMLMRYAISKISIIAVILFAVSTSAISFGTSNVNAQSEDTKPAYEVSISRDANSQVTIADGASYISSFDTTYTIKGTESDFRKGTDLVISSIVEDFDNSSTIGYIKVKEASAEGGTNATGLANPFASVEQINEKIKSVLDSVIDSIFVASGLTFTIGTVMQEIKCTFGDNLDDFECHKVEGFKFG